MNYLINKILIILIISLIAYPASCFSGSIHISKVKETKDIEGFLGTWYMQTVVTQSDCPFVITGTTTESNLEIKPSLIKNIKNQIFNAVWKGGKWSTTKSRIKILNEKEAITERVTKIKTKDRNEWKSILIDHFTVLNKDKMELNSIVLQYKNKEFIGEYRTYSILTKNLEKN